MHSRKQFSKYSKQIRLTLVILILLTIAVQNVHSRWDVLDIFGEHTNAVNSVAFSPGGKMLASASRDGTVILWNPLTRRKIRKLLEYNDIAFSVAFNADSLLASAYLDGKIILWNSMTGEEKVLQHNGVRCVAFSPDGQLLASGSQPGIVRLWNPNEGKQIGEDIHENEGDITSLAFSPNGTLLAIGSYDSTVKLWNVRDQGVIKTLSPRLNVYSVAFISDNQLAIGLQNGTIKLWNLKRDTETGVKVLQGHKAAVTSVKFDSKNQLLASGSEDGSIKIWKPQISTDVITLEGYNGPINSVAFSPDSNLLVSGADDGTVKVWPNIILSVHIKDENSFPKTINRNELLLDFIIEPQEVKARIGVRYSYNLNDEGWGELPEEKNSLLLKSLKDGVYKFEVRATSTVWKINPTPASITFTVNSSPDTKIVSQQMKKHSVIFYLTGKDTQTEEAKLQYQWRIDGGNWSHRSSNIITIPLKQYSLGEHVFEARAIDEEEKFDSTPVQKLFTITIPEQKFPQTIITNPPTETVKTNTYSFHFDGKDSSTPKEKLRYSWRIDNERWSDPSRETIAVLTNLSAGQHLFEVKAIDTEDNDDPDPAEAYFEVERQFPETFITQMPEDPVKTTNATFQFSGSDLQTPTNRLRYSWRIDNERWSDPSKETIAVLTDLSAGQHLFEVKAIDANGNKDPNPAAKPFEVSIEEQFPDTRITHCPREPVKTPCMIFKFTGIDLQTKTSQLKYSWRIDTNPWSELTSETMAQYDQKLPKGLHWFEVRAIDADGNGDPTPDKRPFTVVEIEGKFPETQIIEPSEHKVFETSVVTFKFTGSNNQTSTEKLRYLWRIDEEEEWSTPSSKTVVTQHFPDGQHLFEVKTIADGNEDSTPAKVTFRVDTKGNLPNTQIVNPPKNPIKTTDFIFRFIGNDLQTLSSQLLYSWRVDCGNWSNPSPNTETHISYLSNGLHRFEVKTIDDDGNEDPTPAVADFQIAIDKHSPNTKIAITFTKPIYSLANFDIPFEGINPQTPSDKLQYSWRIDDKPWSEPSLDMKASPKSLSDGWHIFEVKTVDSDGNADPIPTSIRFFVDKEQQYPETEITNVPQNIIETSDTTIHFRGEDLQNPSEKLRYSWRIVGSQQWSEPSEKTMVRLTDLSDGLYWFQVKSVDLDDNEDPIPAEVQFEVAINEEFPDTQIVWEINKKMITKSNVKIDFTGDDSKTPSEKLLYLWRYGDRTWTTPSAKTVAHLKNLPNGKYHFQVKAIDTDGNEDPTPAEMRFWIAIPWYKKTINLLFLCILSVIIIFSLIFFFRVTRYTIWLGNLIANEPLGNVFNQLKKLLFNLQEKGDEAKRIIYDFRLQKDRLQNLGKISRQYSHSMRTPISAIDAGFCVLSYGAPRILNLMNQYEELYQLDNLNEIKSHLQKLQREREQIKELFSTLEGTQTAINQMHDQMDDFSNIVREEYGQGRKLTDMKLDDVISLIVRIIKTTTYKGADIRFQSADVRFIPGEIPSFRCDDSRLKTALIAIIENALEAISADGYVEISTKYHPSDKSVLISIRDTGHGIPRSIQDKVWDESFTTREREEEAGIGLTIAKYVIEDELHGKIWFESEESKGTKFFIKLNTETFEK